MVFVSDPFLMGLSQFTKPPWFLLWIFLQERKWNRVCIHRARYERRFLYNYSHNSIRCTIILFVRRNFLSLYSVPTRYPSRLCSWSHQYIYTDSLSMLVCRLCMRFDSNDFNTRPDLILHGSNEGDCLHAPWSLPWCPRNVSVQIYKFLIGCRFPGRWCLGAIALSKTKRTYLPGMLVMLFLS